MVNLMCPCLFLWAEWLQFDDIFDVYVQFLCLKSLTGQILYKQSKIKSRSKLAKRKPDQTKIEVLPSLD
jgi:hypothetical protein